MKRLFLFVALLVLGGAMAWAQTTSGTSATSGTNSSSGNQSTATTPADQNTGNTGSAATSDQSSQGNSGTAATSSNSGASSDQGAAAGTTGTSHKGKKSGRLPQTASPLPFLGMLGFGSMAAGMMVRKLRR